MYQLKNVTFPLAICGRMKNSFDNFLFISIRAFIKFYFYDSSHDPVEFQDNIINCTVLAITNSHLNQGWIQGSHHPGNVSNAC